MILLVEFSYKIIWDFLDDLQFLTRSYKLVQFPLRSYVDTGAECQISYDFNTISILITFQSLFAVHPSTTAT